MGIEKFAIPAIGAISNRPAVSNAMFRFTKWGNPFSDERFRYPYPMYERIRADGPVVHKRMYQQWFVTGHDEVLEVLRSPNVGMSAARDLMLSVRPFTKLSSTARTNFSRWLLVNDPPDHTRLRSAVSRAFTPKRIAGLEPQMHAVVDELLAELSSVERFDAVERFTARLPIFVIADLLGLPRERWEWLLNASSEIFGLLDPFGRFNPDSVNRCFAELTEYFTEIVEERRVEPRADLISSLASAEDDNVLDTDEVIAMIAFLLFAGHETVTGLLGNSIVALAKHPEQRALLRSSPDLIDNAVDELLRYDSPAQASGRQAIADVTIGGVTIPKGSTIAIMIGAANRDKRRWPDADELLLDRPNPQPISFGHGIHYCVGAALARLEARVALPKFLHTFGDYIVDTENTRWKRSITLRAPISLPIERGSARRSVGAT